MPFPSSSAMMHKFGCSWWSYTTLLCSKGREQHNCLGPRWMNQCRNQQVWCSCCWRVRSLAGQKTSELPTTLLVLWPSGTNRILPLSDRVYVNGHERDVYRDYPSYSLSLSSKARFPKCDLWSWVRWDGKDVRGPQTICSNFPKCSPWAVRRTMSLVPILRVQL